MRIGRELLQGLPPVQDVQRSEAQPGDLRKKGLTLQRNQARLTAIADALLGQGVRCIVEVGARDCRETLEFAERFPAARLYVFECNPDTLPTCRAAVRGNTRIRLIEKAVSDAPGHVKFYPVDPATNPGASSLFRASGKYQLETYEQREIVVEAVTLETALADEPAIDILWMDIQGAELAALKGLGRRIRDVALMHIEVEFEEIYAGQPLFPEVRAFLERAGFRFLGFTVYARHSADAVFANRGRFGVLQTLSALARNRVLLQKRLQYARHRLKHRLVGKL